jgi:hypothetical protein
VRGNAPQDLVIRFEDAFSAVLGALIACFKYDRKLLGELSRCFYDSIKEIFLLAAPQAGVSSGGLRL